eukprot:Nk52_evm3s334 gene=Nk52_evmTU3s334
MDDDVEYEVLFDSQNDLNVSEESVTGNQASSGRGGFLREGAYSRLDESEDFGGDASVDLANTALLKKKSSFGSNRSMGREIDSLEGSGRDMGFLDRVDIELDELFEDDDGEIHAHKAVEGGHGHAHGAGKAGSTGNVSTFMNLLKSYLGSGVLGLPFAFSQSGFIAGIVILGITAFFATHSMLMLIKTKAMLKDRGAESFADVAYLSFGHKMSVAVNILLVFTQFGFCIVYMVFVSDNVLRFFPTEHQDMGRFVVLVVLFPAFYGLALIRSLKWIGPVSAIANILFLFGTGVVEIAALFQLIFNVIPGQALNVDVMVKWDTLPLMFGMAVYAFEGIGVVLPCQTAMKDAKRFPSVLTYAMAVATCCYILFGGICYLAFGKDTNDNITANFEEFANHSSNKYFWNFLVKIVRICLIFVIMSTFPVQLYVVTDICELELFKPGRLSQENRTKKENIFRFLLVLLATVIAISVHNFGLLMGLVGAFGSCALQFVFPAAFYLKTGWDVIKPTEKYMAIIYLFFGVFGGVIGTITTLHELHESFN